MWVATLLLVVEVLLRRRRLRATATLVGASLANPDERPPPPRTPLELTAAEQRGLRCVRRVVRAVPESRGMCLREAVLMAHVLRRRQPRLVIGVTRSDATFVAHAWIEVEGHVLGRPSPHRLVAGGQRR
jgi:hypothetical protein